MAKRGKRGQFYIIAAIVLAAIIIGLTTISNYSKTNANPRLNDLKEELQIESLNTLDYAVSQGNSESEIDIILRDFATDYIDSKGSGKNLYFIFGTQTSITIGAHQVTQETVSINVGSGLQSVSASEDISFQTFTPTTSNLIFRVNGEDYNLKLKQGENFYFLISQETNEERYVVTNFQG